MFIIGERINGTLKKTALRRTHIMSAIGYQTKACYTQKKWASRR
ncbi:MAG: hypothetical protein V2B19_15135 [Pseudomonadota bacterium]